MHRACCLALVLIFLSGCHIPPEQLPLQPVPQNGAALSYTEVALRARLQATAATEAFYLNDWKSLAAAGRNLEETARMLVMTSEVPARHKDRVNGHSDELAKAAAELRKAAEAQDVMRCNELLQRINLKVRELRLE